MIFQVYARWKRRGLPIRRWQVRETHSDYGRRVWTWSCELRDGTKLSSRRGYGDRWVAVQQMRKSVSTTLRRNAKLREYGRG